MATYTPQQGLDYCKNFVSLMPIDRIQNRMVQGISDMIWYAFPWRWSVSELSVVSLVANQQDYTITIPTDFEYVEQAYITDGTTRKPIFVEGFLPDADDQTGVVSTVSIIRGTPDKARVYPTPGTLQRPWKLILIYKKKSPQIPRSDFSIPGVLQIPDQWGTVFEEGLLWKCYSYAYDQKAGDVSKNDKGDIRYSGQIGTFMTALERMKECEKGMTAIARMIPSPERTIG